MQRLKLPRAQDVVRFIRPTVDETIELLKSYYEQQPAWNYGPARAMAKVVFSGELPLHAAIQHCKTRGNPLGRESNAQVAELIWRSAQGEASTVTI